MTEPARDVIVLVCEGPTDPRVARGFAERVLKENVGHWDDLTASDIHPDWQGLRASENRLEWDNVPREYVNAGLRKRHGHFDGDLPGEPDARAGRKALALVSHYRPEAIAVVLLRDADNQPERLTGLKQARDEHENQSNPFKVIIGVAKPNREAWVLLGFQPKNDTERSRLEVLKQQNSFDPTREPERLNAKAESDSRNTKHVLGKLTGNNFSREEPCWSETPLEILHANGEACGLKAYLEEVESRLAPLFDANRSR
jgi:hypothetical protein